MTWIFGYYFGNFCPSGLDDVLAEHIAHLFIRDPISLFAEKLNLNDEVEVDHFEVNFGIIVGLKRSS